MSPLAWTSLAIAWACGAARTALELEQCAGEVAAVVDLSALPSWWRWLVLAGTAVGWPVVLVVLGVRRRRARAGGAS
ncbi:hypothetical protein ACFV5N_09415 [Streptomyces sp. NPDC059853]|uniref:hypothetical protein n=1 Tax=Streptomyces TaxID=1883 RepID=UPI00364DC7F7